MLDQALAQLPEEAREDWKLLVRADTAGATRKFARALRERKIRFSLGYPVQEQVGQAARCRSPSGAGSRRSTETAGRARGPG